MYQALYRKYRPKKFADVIDQKYVVQVLTNSIKNNRISHAYLFSGPRGIGKTSIAKIFAKAVNCLDFNKTKDICENCINCLSVDDKSPDIIEIDAASNNGVDQIRDLKSKVNIMPTSLKYKVYIIDEVHMLTASAFNALLKTLEEPPSHIIFILATTEFYAVPETIVSRCQCFKFSRITNDSMIEHLKKIAEVEKISIDDDVIKEIAYASAGGLRDAISMLDKIGSFTTENITMEEYKNINGFVSLKQIEDAYDCLMSSNFKRIIEIINIIDVEGYDISKFVERLMIYVRDLVTDYYIKKNSIKYSIKNNCILVEKLNSILNMLKVSTEPLIVIQTEFIKIAIEFENKEQIISQEISNKTLKSVVPVSKNEPVKEKVESKVTNDVEQYSINEGTKKIRINNSLGTANINYKKNITSNWQSLRNYFIDEENGKFAKLLIDTTPMVVGEGYMILTAPVASLIEKIYLQLNQIEKFLTVLNQKTYKIVVVTEIEFENIKKDYISNKNNKDIYQFKEEIEPLISYNSINNANKSGNDVINKALEVFGSEYVEIE